MGTQVPLDRTVCSRTLMHWGLYTYQAVKNRVIDPRHAVDFAFLLSLFVAASVWCGVLWQADLDLHQPGQ